MGGYERASRVYTAEAGSGLQWMGGFPSLRDAQMWVSKIVRSAWWKKHCPRVVKVACEYRPDKVWHRAPSISEAGVGRLRFAAGGLCQGVALHELAHFIAWSERQDHGSEFVRAEHALYKQVMGKGIAGILKVSFVEWGVWPSD